MSSELCRPCFGERADRPPGRGKLKRCAKRDRLRGGREFAGLISRGDGQPVAPRRVGRADPQQPVDMRQPNRAAGVKLLHCRSMPCWRRIRGRHAAYDGRRSQRPGVRVVVLLGVTDGASIGLLLCLQPSSATRGGRGHPRGAAIDRSPCLSTRPRGWDCEVRVRRCTVLSALLAQRTGRGCGARARPTVSWGSPSLRSAGASMLPASLDVVRVRLSEGADPAYEPTPGI
jgi:hypothetical protein